MPASSGLSRSCAKSSALTARTEAPIPSSPVTLSRRARARALAVVVPPHAVGDDAGERLVERMLERPRGRHRLLGHPEADGDAVLVGVANRAAVGDPRGVEADGHSGR